jgi:hypothetical protein
MPASDSHNPLPVSDDARVRELLAEALEYAEHLSWRCAYPPHFYLADKAASDALNARGDCPCHLLGFEKAAREALEAGER